MFLQSFPAAVAGNLSLIPEYITPQFSLVRGVIILPHEADELVTIGGFIIIVPGPGSIIACGTFG